MRSWHLERKLVIRLLLPVLVPAVLAGGALVALRRAGVFVTGSPASTVVLLAVLAVVVISVAAATWVVARSLARGLQAMQRGTELMATVNPGYRLEAGGGDEIEALSVEINRLADRLRDTRAGLEAEVSRATRALGLERGKLSAILDRLDEGVVVATLEGRVSLANRRAQELLGAAAGGLLGRNLLELVDRDKVTHHLDRLRSGEAPAERFSLHPATGAVLQTGMTPFLDGDGHLTGFILALRDVSRPARDEETQQRLLGEILRELHAPVASIRSLTENLLADPGFGGPARPLLQAILDDAVRLSGVVKERLPPQMSRPPGHFDEISVSDLVAVAGRRLAREGTDGGLTGASPAASEPLSLKADVSALTMALAHLMATALARRAIGGTAWCRPQQRGRVVQIDIGADSSASLTDIEGTLDEPVAADQSGRLAVREVVRRHAGEVWAYADAGQVGFRLNLPLAEPREPVPVAEGAWSFVGAGMVSGFGGEGLPDRPEFYDFSLLDEMERSLLPADRERALAQITFVVLDTETTGLHPEDGDRIVSLAAVKVRGGVVKSGETFDALVNPGRPVPAESVRFHGISDAMVATAPPIDVVLPAFLRFAEDAVLVGHQVWFDLRFLGREVERLGLPRLTLAHPVLDTCLLSEFVHGPAGEHGLDAVAARLGVTISGRHSALGDALATAQVFVRLLELFAYRGIRTLGEALDAGRRARGTGPRTRGRAKGGT